MLGAQEAGPDAWPGMEKHKHTYMQHWHLVWHRSQTKFLLTPTDITKFPHRACLYWKDATCMIKTNLQTSVSSRFSVGEQFPFITKLYRVRWVMNCRGTIRELSCIIEGLRKTMKTIQNSLSSAKIQAESSPDESRMLIVYQSVWICLFQIVHQGTTNMITRTMPQRHTNPLTTELFLPPAWEVSWVPQNIMQTNPFSS
jgi:hypothetical protein